MKINLTLKVGIICVLALFVAVNISAQKVRNKSKVKMPVKPAVSWKTYDICQNSVRVDLPVAPIEQLDSTSFVGTVITIRTNRITFGNSVYTVSCFEGLPLQAETWTLVQKKAFFDGMMKDFASQMDESMRSMGFKVKVKLLPAQVALIDSHLGYEQSFTIGPSRGLSKITFYGNRGVWSLVMQANRNSESAFFNSLKIN